MKRFLLILILLINCYKGDNNKGVLTVSLETFPLILDPRYATDQSSERVFSLIHRGLFKISEKFEFEGDVVEDYKFEKDRLTLKLKEDVFFSDGKNLQSDDVVFTLNSILKGEKPSFRRGELSSIEKVIKRGPYKVEIFLKEPLASLPMLLNFGILEKGAKSSENIPIGAGFYKIDKIKKGLEIELLENPFSKEKPKTKRLILKVIEDTTLRTLELYRGSLDIVVNDIPLDSIKKLKEKGFLVKNVSGTNYSYIGLNLKKYPLNKKEVRVAISMAINRRAILKNIFLGYGREADSMLSPENWAYKKGKTISYNPTKSKEIIEKEGIKNITLSYKTSLSKISRFLAEAIKEDLKKIGINLKIETLEWGTFYNDIKRGNFDMFSLNWIGIKDPDAYRLRFHSKMVPPLGFNRGYYSNFTLDKLLEEGVIEIKREKRKEIYSKVQQIILEDEPYISLFWPDIVVVAKKNIKIEKIPNDGNFSFLKDVIKE